MRITVQVMPLPGGSYRCGARRYGIRRQNGGGLVDFEDPSPVGFQSRKPLAILLSEYASARRRAFNAPYGTHRARHLHGTSILAEIFNAMIPATDSRGVKP